MLVTAYVREDDPQLADRVRLRFEREMRSLATLGFRELCLYSERMGPHSASWRAPILLLMAFGREVIRIGPRLEVSGTFPLLEHREPSTTALVMGMGVKLYTGFADGTILISTSFRSFAQPDARSGVIDSLPDPWRMHGPLIARRRRD